jgi:DNA-binding MarR family transcriptional regulator
MNALSSDRELFRRLPSFRLHVLAQHSERLHEQRYKRLFGLDLRECRIIGIVGGYRETSLWRIRVDMNLGRASVSLLIARLIRRGLLAKVVDARDRRMKKIALTPRSRAIHKALQAEAISLNEEWLSTIPKQQRETFSACLDVLTTSARSIRKSQP